MTTDAAPPAREELLAALTRLMSRWSSSEVQARIAHGVGVALDPTEIRAVYTLGLHGGTARPSAWADELHVSRPTMSKLIARLTADDLIGRTADPDDGRAALVVFTARGRAAYDRLVAAGHHMVGGVLEGWDPADVAAFGGLLTRFVDGLLDATPAASDSPAHPA